jgi:HrpA-like RNA helicase
LIDKSSNLLKRDPTEINQLGRVLSKLPLSPKYAKMLIVSTKYKVLRFTIMMVACMSVNELFSNKTTVAPVQEEIQQ